MVGMPIKLVTLIPIIAKLAGGYCSGTTGLVCIDSFSRELRETGYLHNHQRMWIAAYLVHWRRVRWQAGAAGF